MTKPETSSLSWRSLLLPASLAAAVFMLVPRDAPPAGGDAAGAEVAQDQRRTRVVRRATVAATEAGTPAPQVYRDRELIVAPVWGQDIEDIASDYDAEVLREPGRSGFGVLKLSEDTDRDALLADSRVLSAAPNARIAGAKKGDKDKDKNEGRGQDKKEDNADISTGTTSETGAETATTDTTTTSGSTGSHADLQWHLADIDLPAGVDLSGVVVAVLDSGVAYESDKIQGTDYVAAPSLAGVDIVAPYDFVDDDAQPLDEHQHGTHIASLIASDGDVVGVAPGVSLMPLRVLDADNAGSEIDLIEAIAWATENKADIINMSLTFPFGYVPSAALRGVIQDAADAGIVMVAASGNEGRDDAPCWPAASPLVIGVGAYVAIPGGDDEVTAYSNLGTGIDMMAPGGDVLTDYNQDGVADGMVGETIGLNDPSTVGAWMFEGTSQAAAVVSGAAAHLVAAGASGDEVRSALLYGSKFWGNNTFSKGTGAGGLDVDDALASLGLSATTNPPEYYAALLAWPSTKINLEGIEEIGARAEVTVINADGSYTSEKLEIFATVWGPDGAEQVSCSINGDASCTLKSDSIPRYVDGERQEAAWAIQVDAIVEDGVEIPRRPGVAMFGSDGLEILLAAIGEENSLNNAALAIGWPEEDHPELGGVAEGFTVVNSGTGLASSPLGLVFTAGALPMGKAKDYELDLDGTGLASSPLGLMQVQRFNIDGTGLASSPLGFSSMKLVAFNGTGLASSPLGLQPTDIFGPGSSSVDAGLGLNGSSILMTTGSLVGASSGASAANIDSLLAGGGWVSEGGYEVASLLAGSGAAAVGLSGDGEVAAGGNAGSALE